MPRHGRARHPLRRGAAAHSGTVAAIGVFDGVHRAHQRILRTAAAWARRLRAVSVAVTFDPDPRHVLDPAHGEPALMPVDERLRRIRETGVQRICVLRFTRQFARMPAEAFVRRVLLDRLRARAVVIGEQFFFGRHRRGDLSMLRRLGQPRGLRIISVPSIMRAGAPVSSSRIRQLVAAGWLAQARALLGRPPALYGRVVPGAGRGRRLGFPTANIALLDQVLPPRGVYAVRLERRDTGWGRPGVMNLGVRPTFGEGPLTCEVHLLNFSGALQDVPVAVSLLGRLRSERCFPTPAALQRQIRIDIRRARRLVARLTRSS